MKEIIQFILIVSLIPITQYGSIYQPPKTNLSRPLFKNTNFITTSSYQLPSSLLWKKIVRRMVQPKSSAAAQDAFSKTRIGEATEPHPYTYSIAPGSFLDKFWQWWNRPKATITNSSLYQPSH